MKILCIIDSLGSGGAQRQLVSIAVLFKEHGHDISFLTYHPLNFYKAILDKNEIPVKCIQENHYLKRFLKLRKYIRNNKADTVLSYLDSPNLICELSGFPFRKWKLIVSERSANPSISISFTAKIKRYFHILSDYIVANSYRNIEMIKENISFIPNRKYKVIYNVVDLDKWKPANLPRQSNLDKFNLIIIASHQYLKNLNGLIEAINLLDPKDKNRLNITWYGDKSKDKSFDDAQLKIKQYQLSSIFQFYPAISNIEEKVKDADALGLFSFYEGLPNAVCEGMACGKPIISSNVSDIPLLLKESNFLFDPNNINEITIQLTRMLNTSKEELNKIGEYNRNIAISLFNSSNIYQQYYQLLQNG